MDGYFVARYVDLTGATRTDGAIKRFYLAKETKHGEVDGGTVVEYHNGDVDVRTGAGAKCFRGTPAYDERIAGVDEWYDSFMASDRNS